MSKTYCTTKRKNVQGKNGSFVQNGWQRVHGDATVALREAKARVRKLQRTVAIIEAKIERNEPFPVSMQN
jgi:hypothetical protein